MEGLRRYSGTSVGDEYRQILAFGTERSPSDPGVAERTIGDLLDPLRPGRVVDVVNAGSREVGVDVAGWRADRLLSLVGGLEREARERDRPES